MDPDFSGSDPDFRRPIRIRTQEKKIDPDPEKTGSETLVLTIGNSHSPSPESERTSISVWEV